MKSKLNKKEAQDKIQKFFLKESLQPKGVKKIRRIAMKFKIPLKEYRKRFCKSCLSDLRTGSIRVTKKYKTIICKSCGSKNRWKI